MEGKLGNNKKITLESFIKRCILIHNDKYSYDNVIFENAHSKIDITCDIHGDFKQKVCEHLLGKGCQKCYFLSNKKNIKDLIDESIDMYGDIYDYSMYEYINSKTKSNLICKMKHTSHVSPNRILSGKFKCLKCVESSYRNKWLCLLSNISNFKYTFVKGEIINIECLTCSSKFERKVSTHYKLKNCIYCNPSKYTKTIFIEKSKEIHNNYNYSLVKYTDSRSKVELVCENGHRFKQIVNNHLNGVGCPLCNKFNKKENLLYEFIRDNYSGDIIKSDRTILMGKELDIFLPDLNLAFEFNGLYWHSDQYKDKKYHLNKTADCLNKNIKLVHIWEDDWDNKQNIVKSIILNKLGKSKKIFARKCTIKIPSNEEVRNFLNDNHIQGFVGSKIKIGLYYNNEMLSLMTFGNLRKSLGQTSNVQSYELLRFCNKCDYSVIGGASKLFKYFKNNYDIKEVISYSDNSRGIGNLYKQLGFKFIHQSVPNYYYIVNGVRKHRFNFRKDKLIREGSDASKTEIQIMRERGYYRIFDCGSKKWVLIISK